MALTISGITWILSYRCNLNCQHCFFDVNGPMNVLDHDLAREALASLEQTYPRIRSICLNIIMSGIALAKRNHYMIKAISYIYKFIYPN